LTGLYHIYVGYLCSFKLRCRYLRICRDERRDEQTVTNWEGRKRKRTWPNWE